MSVTSHNSPSRRTLLIYSQVFIPDPASVGQHVADVAVEMARRGYPVRVYTSARGYEDPTIKYPRRETIRGVEVRRLPLASFGKKSILTRILGTAAFMTQALVAGLCTRDLGGVFFSTSPPLVGVIASIVGRLRGVPIAYWAMDLNPDQLIALGKLKPTDTAARLLEAVNRHILRRSALIVALDRFMADRLDRREPALRLRDKMLVMPPWPHEEHIMPVAESTRELGEGDNPFRIRHGLTGKFVVMYSGNHSPSNPLTTLLDAAMRFKRDPDVRFVFVGGGIGKKAVEAVIREHGLTNAISLPYQPLAGLGQSLSAADVHVVSLGQGMVGIIHPCKAYGAMAAGRPLLYFGPRPSHISDILDAHPIGRCVMHGDVDGAVAAIEDLTRLAPAARAEMGRLTRAVLRQSLGQELLCSRFCDRLEQALYGKEPRAAAELTEPAKAAEPSGPAAVRLTQAL
jgi:colanic acid biosynthesis glycosyl transferase WcaI